MFGGVEGWLLLQLNDMKEETKKKFGRKKCRVVAKIVLNEINCLNFMKNYLFVIELMRMENKIRRNLL